MVLRVARCRRVSMKQSASSVVIARSAPLALFAATLERAPDFAAAMDVLLGAAQRLGFDGVDYSYVPAYRCADGAWTAPPVETRAFPSGWDRHWDRYSADDPYYHACIEGTDWIDWLEVQSRPQLTARERLSIAYLADHGITRGLTIPIRAGQGLAFVSGLGRPNDRLERTASSSFDSRITSHTCVRRRHLLAERGPRMG